VRQLLAEAARLGVSVHIAHIPDDPSLRGYYVADRGMIVLRYGLTRAETRSVLAHELGHAFYRHQSDGPAAERQADIYAARLLVDAETYARLERVNPDRHELAEQLDVTVDVIRTFAAHCLSRLDGITYASPKMGARQWAYRAVSA
jgi:Zn-dependent peptidase ImmA (M78 family)